MLKNIFKTFSLVGKLDDQFNVSLETKNIKESLTLSENRDEEITTSTIEGQIKGQNITLVRSTQKRKKLPALIDYVGKTDKILLDFQKAKTLFEKYYQILKL